MALKEQFWFGINQAKYLKRKLRYIRTSIAEGRMFMTCLEGILKKVNSQNFLNILSILLSHYFFLNNFEKFIFFSPPFQDCKWWILLEKLGYNFWDYAKLDQWLCTICVLNLGYGSPLNCMERRCSFSLSWYNSGAMDISARMAAFWCQNVTRASCICMVMDMFTVEPD